MGQLIAETLPTRVLRDETEVRAATALITIDVWASIYAGIPGRHACFIRLAGQAKTGQRHSYKAPTESFQGLAPGYGLRHTFGQLINSATSLNFGADRVPGIAKDLTSVVESR